MDRFLYDIDLRRERVKGFSFLFEIYYEAIIAIGLKCIIFPELSNLFLY